MATEFWVAPSYIKELADELLASYHPEVVTASIAYLMKSEASSSEAESSQVCIAKKVTGLYRILTNEVDFVILIANDLWSELSPVQQKAALDSALTSCSAKVEDGEFKLDNGGNPIWVIKPFDIIGHSEVVSRYGIDVLRETGEVIRQALAEPVAVEVEITRSVTDDSPSAEGTRKPRKARKAG